MLVYGPKFTWEEIIHSDWAHQVYSPYFIQWLNWKSVIIVQP